MDEGEGRRIDLVAPLFVVLIGLAATALVTWQIWYTLQNKDRERFESQSVRLREAVGDRIDTYIALLESGAGLFSINQEVTRSDFTTYLARLRLDESYPGVQGIGWSRQITPEEKPAIEAQMRLQGLPSFRIWPDHEREIYHSILYLEPLDRRNRAAIGFDMFTEEVRRKAMERARDSGAPAATGKLTLVQEIEPKKQSGFLVYVPVYRGGLVPTSVQARRELLLGFIYSPFRAGDLFAGIVPPWERQGMAFEVYDGENPNPEEVLYSSQQHISPGSFSRFVSTQTLEVAGNHWTVVFRTGPAFDASSGWRFLPIVTATGICLTLMLAAVAVFQAKGRSRAEGIAADLQRSQIELLRSEGRFRKLADAMPQIVFTAGPDGQVDYYNRRWFEYTGQTEEEVYHQRGWRAVIHPEDAGLCEDLWQRAMAEGEPFMCEFRLRNGLTAEYRWHLARAIAVRDESGEIYRWFGGSTDIHDQRTSAEALRTLGEELSRRNEELAQAARQKDDFLAMLAHELRNPIAAISNAISVAARTTAEADRQWAHGVVNNQVTHLSRMLDDLLDVSRITRGKIELQLRPLELNRLLLSAVDAVRPAAQERKQTITVKVSEKSGWVKADPTRLEQIMVNLINNAVKYTGEGGVIQVSSKIENDTVVFSVKDNGVGIPQHLLDRMFDLFVQGDRSIARSEGGLGIGLTVVRSLVEMHGGTVNAFSEGAGKGSEFVVRLPAVDPPKELQSLTPTVLAAVSGEPLRVLVVEDNADTAQGLVRLLTMMGHQVEEAHDGRTALAAAAAFSPQVVLLDIGLPGMDGYSVAQRLRADEQFRNTKIIALSGYGEEQAQERSRQAGMNHHLIKPVDVSALVELLSPAEGIAPAI